MKDSTAWALAGVMGITGLGLIFFVSSQSRKTAGTKMLPGPSPLEPAVKAKVESEIATSRDPKMLKTLAAGLQKKGAIGEAHKALQKVADLTGQTQSLPGIASLPTITITPGGGGGLSALAQFGPGMLASTKPTLRVGSTGPAVTEWQKIVGVAADGKFGPGTQAATKKWQASKGLAADGVVGPQSWTKALGG